MSRIITISGEEILAKKYRIRMRYVLISIALVASVTIEKENVLECMFFQLS